MFRFAIAALLLALSAPAYAQIGTTIGNLYPGVVTAALSSANTSTENSAALQAAFTTACSSSAPNKAVRLPVGSYNLDSTTITINCGSIDVGGWGGYFSTLLNIGTGNNDFLKCVQPAGVTSACWHTKFHDFTILRSDSPTSGAGLFLDHANDVQVSNMRIYGFFYDVDCNYCQNVTFDTGFNAGGVQSQTGSAIMRVRRTISTVALAADWTSGTTVTLASLTGVYLGMTVTGHANIQSATTVVSCNSGAVTCVLSKTPTGTVPSATSLTFTDSHPGSIFLGDGFNLAGNPALTNYDNGLVLNDVDGFWLGNGHIAYTRGADMLLQPEHSSDHVHGILSATNTYFDQPSTNCIAVKAYGAVEATTGGTTAAGNTTLTLTGAPSTDVTGYSILANGVDSGTTVSSGGSTSSITMSAGANALGIANGDWVVFYPAFTGSTGSNSFYGVCNSAGTEGVLLADPAAARQRVEINGHNANRALYDFKAGTYINATGSLLYNANQANASWPTVLVEGNAAGVDLMATTFNSGTSAPPYHVQKKGQAGSLNVSGTFAGSTSVDVIDSALTSGATKMGACSTDNVTLSTINGVGCPLIGQIAASGLPFVIPGSGSMANNGVLTITAALDRTYARAFFYMPANAISAGSAAGWYYTVCTTTTACTVKNNTYSSGIPSIPASPTAFVTTGPGAYTQDTSEIVGYSLTVPANSMGINGSLRSIQRFAFNNSGNNKTIKVKYGSTNVFAKAYTTNNSLVIPMEIQNRSVTTQQVTVTAPTTLDTVYGVNSTALTQAGENTAAATTYALSCQLAAATDFCVMESVKLDVYPAP